MHSAVTVHVENIYMILFLGARIRAACMQRAIKFFSVFLTGSTTSFSMVQVIRIGMQPIN